jgi:hypothetical protein
VWHCVKQFNDLGQSLLVQSPNKRWLRELPKDLTSVCQCSPESARFCSSHLANNQISRLQGSVCEGHVVGSINSHDYVELWFGGVNIAEDFARQGLGQRLREEPEEEE